MIKSKIGWTDSTHNFWEGCHKVSAGCKFCYMHRIQDGKKIDPNVVVKFDGFRKPLKWEGQKLIFTCSMSDFFIEEADEWRPEAWEIISLTPQHTWLILTKRPERIKDCLPPDWGNGYPNVWLGVSVEDNKSLHRLETMGEIPAKLRFVSAEPLLETVDFMKVLDGNRPIDKFEWIIIGGESGNDYGKHKYRECRERWIYDTLKPLYELGKYIFVKQVGAFVAKNDPKQIIGQDQHGSVKRFWHESIQIHRPKTH
ncbi:MAG: phage Gp37/Gp68 family protein [Cryomorphaceae bacterium]|nr:phage Gp37/Gp68 family protein [Cryomorphaceae bacterium]